MEVLSDTQRTMVFIRRGILVSAGSRCCSDHLYKGQLSYEGLWQINGSISDHLALNSSEVQGLMEDFRSSIQASKSFDFDDPSCLSDECYFNITGLKKGTHFNGFKYFSFSVTYKSGGTDLKKSQ